MSASQIKNLFRNAKCGKLVCQGGSTTPVIGRDRTKYITSVSTNNGQDVVKCKTIASSVTDNDVTEIGLVRKGTSCGKEKVSCTYLKKKFIK